jgi:hypothetical protein
MKKSNLLPGIIPLLSLIFLAGCQDMDDYNDQQGNLNSGRAGHLVIKLTDAPFPFEMIEAATVNIVKVEIRKVSEGDEEGNPFIELPLPDDSNEFNLLELRDGITADLVDMEIEPGNYDLIRLYVDEAGLAVIDGNEYKVKVPSGPQTGIKVFLNPALKVVSELTTDLVLDFDLEKSFVLKGNAFTPAGIKGFNFKPVVKAMNNTTDGTLAGEVSDAVTDGLLPEAAVWIEQDGSIINSDLTNVDGYYAIDSIPAGYYDAIAALEGYYNDTVEGLEIVEGNLTVQDFTLTPITGMLEGVVTDDLDPATPLEGASILVELVVEEDTTEIATASTVEDGSYSIEDIRIGIYDVIASMDGFVNDTAKGVEIVDGSVTVNFTLAAVEETTSEE